MRPLAVLIRHLLFSSVLRCVLAVEFGPIGCYVDNTGSVRDLNGLAGRSTIGPYNVDTVQRGVLMSSMTLQLCSTICSIGSFVYFGVQNGDNCFCGNSFGSQGVAAASDCNRPCVGDASQICGAGGRNSVYRLLYLRPIGTPLILQQTGRLYLNVSSSSGPFYRSQLQPIRSDVECFMNCNADCQAVLVGPGVCQLLKFPAVPHELLNMPGEFYVRF